MYATGRKNRHKTLERQTFMVLSRAINLNEIKGD